MRAKVVVLFHWLPFEQDHLPFKQDRQPRQFNPLRQSVEINERASFHCQSQLAAPFLAWYKIYRRRSFGVATEPNSRFSSDLVYRNAVPVRAIRGKWPTAIVIVGENFFWNVESFLVSTSFAVKRKVRPYSKLLCVESEILIVLKFIKNSKLWQKKREGVSHKYVLFAGVDRA